MSNTTMLYAGLAVLLAIAVLIKVFNLAMLGVSVRAGLQDVGKKSLEKQPDSIHLAAASDHIWRNAEVIGKLEDVMRARGFSRTGDYSIPELPGFTVRFLINSIDKAYATIYEHEKAGSWIELITRYQDDSGATFTMAPDRGVHHRPQDVVVHAPGTTADALCARMLKERPKKPLLDLSSDALVKLFEDAYKQQIDWRKQQGISAGEVAHIIAARGGKT